MQSGLDLTKLYPPRYKLLQRDCQLIYRGLEVVHCLVVSLPHGRHVSSVESSRLLECPFLFPDQLHQLEEVNMILESWEGARLV
jgi:hypothetical protein